MLLNDANSYGWQITLEIVSTRESVSIKDLGSERMCTTPLYHKTFVANPAEHTTYRMLLNISVLLM